MSPSPSTEPVVLSADRRALDEFWSAHRRHQLIGLRTSGTTTGNGRIIVRTTDSWVDSFPPTARICALTSADTVWIPGPMGATMNLFAACLAQHTGARWTVDDPRSATVWQLTPARLTKVLDAGLPGSDRLRGVIVAGDGLSPVVRDRARAAGLAVTHYYGAAELSMIAMGSCRDDLELFDRVEVSIRSGHIWVRSPWLSRGYLHPHPRGSLRVDPDGFATVGDHGELDGLHLTVTGRDGAVTTAGQTVLLAPLLARLQPLAHGDVFLVGSPREGVGEVLTAVVTEAGDLPVLRRWARAHLEGADRPRRWLCVPDPPLTEAGKIDIGVLGRDSLSRQSSDGRPPGRHDLGRHDLGRSTLDGSRE